MPVKTAVGSYKGNATISLDADSRYPFTFGVKKAQMILECLPQIEAFVKAHTSPAGQQRDVMGVDRQYEEQCRQACGL